ncbi:hypothetical protein T4A_10288 [Trichinella pseudospiralis]|uniref:Uncharacterized protein n=1 Tax=Trichinella pseudospiralis TaxID=6337 RepID=A0A0V1DSY5_TRIPS|nr:hypothetical protein T4A_12683 [Trichinella pseudospiralis]KRY67999.1 hypothetical protein T4A_10288 [Trichinella pseudospiralis]
MTIAQGGWIWWRAGVYDGQITLMMVECGGGRVYVAKISLDQCGWRGWRAGIQGLNNISHDGWRR